MNKSRVAMMLAGLAMLTGACTSTSDGDAEPIVKTSVADSVQTSTHPLATTSTQSETEVGTSEGVVTGVAPDSVIQDVFEAAEELTDASRVEMGLLQAQSVTWPDGSLGCPKPGFEYTQALVDGHWIRMVFNDTVFDFRVSENGQINLCDSSETAPELGPDR